MFMVLSSWQSHCESSPGSFDECRTAPSGRQPRLVAMSQARRLRLRVRLYSLLESTPTIAIYYNYSARKLDRQKSLHIANDRRQPDSYNGRLMRNRIRAFDWSLIPISMTLIDLERPQYTVLSYVAFPVTRWPRST